MNEIGTSITEVHMTCFLRS